eukprot:6202680-Prymnesium_polylepis.1
MPAATHARSGCSSSDAGPMVATIFVSFVGAGKQGMRGTLQRPSRAVRARAYGLAKRPTGCRKTAKPHLPRCKAAAGASRRAKAPSTRGERPTA